MTRLKGFALCLIVCFVAGADLFAQKVGEAMRTDERIRIDGRLEEESWSKAPVLTDFVQGNPKPGMPPAQQTEVRILYDDEALYVSAVMFDSAPDSILRQMTQRDEHSNADYFGITLSCFRDGLNGFYFAITPDAIQLDVLLTVFGDDDTWNAVWWAEAQITDFGWVAEFKIPYAAFRFPRREVQEWDVNFERSIRRIRELSYWNPVDPEIDGFLVQSGILRGIRDITPPPRLFFYPYASTYADRAPRPDGRMTNSTQWNAGMDVKYGLTDAYTLDMTLVPDFGQVQFDPFVLNLSPFEVRFNENRQFFQEGTELFNKGDLFYSRRIGGFPIGFGRAYSELNDNEVVMDNPETSQLINATKISGRGKSGTGLGVFNAVAAPTYATLRDTLTGEQRSVQTASLTNYSVLVIDQNLNKNSFVSLINTNVLRSGSDYDANVTGLEFQVRDEKNRYQVAGGGAYNRKFFGREVPGDRGLHYDLGIAKVSGQWRWGVSTTFFGADYDPTDLGFLFNNNERTYDASLTWNRFKPKGAFNRLRLGTYAGVQQVVRPAAFYRMWLGVNGFAFTKNFHAFGFDAWINPTPLYDYYDTRVDGRYVIQPVNGRYGGWFSSDYRKVVALDADYYQRRFDAPDRLNHSIRFGPRWRVNDRLMLISNYTLDLQYMDFGYAHMSAEGPIFGHRDVTTHTYSLTASYIFTNNMALSLRGRHYWSKAEYDRFEQLELDGTTTLIDQTPYIKEGGGTNRDISFNSYTIDLVYRWVFVPGSEVNVVWKNAIIDGSNDIPATFSDNLTYTFGLPQANSISIRVLYFLDYLTIRRALSSRA